MNSYKNLLKLAKKYDKEYHMKNIQKSKTRLPETLEMIYDKSWETDESKIPYEILTQLLDCYYCLPDRPDLAVLFCWQAINHSYNEFLLGNNRIKNLQDTKGIEKLLDKINGNRIYKDYLNPFINAITKKSFKFVASYFLKGYVISEKNLNMKYANSSYKKIKGDFPDLYNVVIKSYGTKFLKISKPDVQGNEVKTNVPEEESRSITNSLADKLMNLVKNRNENFELSDGTIEKVTFTDEYAIGFVVKCILYASRCNNFHGNVASRLNSINAKKDTFIQYTNLFLLEYMILAISLHSQGYLSDESLKRVSENKKLLLDDSKKVHAADFVN